MPLPAQVATLMVAGPSTNDIGGTPGLDDGGVVVVIALKPSLEVRFGGEQVVFCYCTNCGTLYLGQGYEG
jgi:hypothetical protein